MKHNFNIVPRETLDLSNNIKACEQSTSIAYHKELELNGNLNLESFYDNSNADGLYVEGDLKVNGNIFGGTCVFLYVGGDLYVDSLFCTADEIKIQIEGDLYVKHFLLTDEDHYFQVKGEIYSSIRIHHPHICYIGDQLKNTKLTFVGYDLIDFWEKIIRDNDNWKKFLETYKDYDGDKYDIGCAVNFVRKYWSFYQNLASQQSVFPMDIIEDEIFDGHITEKNVSEKTFKAVFEHIKNIGKKKPSEKHCENY